LRQAGFHVVGVDVNPQPNHCCDAFIQSDALTYLKTADLSDFVLIWSSPPCQRYSSLRHAPGVHRDADLVEPTRELLVRSG
jgi:DNA (cytosine-5)-methyltransferase 1